MARSKAAPGQLGFVFDPPPPAVGEACLAGYEQRINRTVATMLKADDRPREVIAAEVSVRLDEEVSRAMLDAYASPARLEHKVPMSRFLALVAVTGRYDLLDALLREIGAALVVGEEVLTVELGHIDRQIAALRDRRKRIEGRAPMLRTGGMDGDASR